MIAPAFVTVWTIGLFSFKDCQYSGTSMETAFEFRTRLPWAARSNARTAFEHALTAQWVLLTDSGEKCLADWLSERDFVRRSRYVEAVVELGDKDTGFVALDGLPTGELESISAERPEKSGFLTFERMCARFDSTGLLYDVQRDLTQSVVVENSRFGDALVFAAVQSDPSATKTVTINSGVAGHWLRHDNPALNVGLARGLRLTTPSTSSAISCVKYAQREGIWEASPNLRINSGNVTHKKAKAPRATAPATTAALRP
jgi:hypothetical protein